MAFSFRVVREKKESADSKTLFFKNPELAKNAEPGRFVMVWAPGVDEIPLSVSYVDDNGLVGVTVKKVGEATEALFAKKKGDWVGLRGPYGTFFKAPGENTAVVAGGIGLASLITLVEKLGKKCRVFYGARTKSELVFLDRLKKSGAEFFLATDDGTLGEKGFVTDVFESFAKNKKPQTVCACGPEIMLKKLHEFCMRGKIRFEASLERWCKCGVGLCGSCVLDSSGLRVCTEGPVFSGEALSKVSDFGSKGRNKCGEKVDLGDLVPKKKQN